MIFEAPGQLGKYLSTIRLECPSPRAFHNCLLCSQFLLRAPVPFLQDNTRMKNNNRKTDDNWWQVNNHDVQVITLSVHATTNCPCNAITLLFQMLWYPMTTTITYSITYGRSCPIITSLIVMVVTIGDGKELVQKKDALFNPVLKTERIKVVRNPKIWGFQEKTKF